MEMEHTVRLRDEGKRIRAEQEKAYNKFIDQMKHKKKEVNEIYLKYIFFSSYSGPKMYT